MIDWLIDITNKINVNMWKKMNAKQNNKDKIYVLEFLVP